MERDLERALAHVSHLLPAQGPINVFVHHNTLHAFEELPFFQAVEIGGETLGCHPYLSESDYRAELKAGNFNEQDIEAVLLEDLEGRDDHWIATLGTRFALHYAMLLHPVHAAPRAELEWLIAETDALRWFRSESDATVRSRMLQSTRRYVLGAVSQNLNGLHPEKAAWLRSVLEAHPSGDPAGWDSVRWESITLQLLWRASWIGTARLPNVSPRSVGGERHRDLLYQATGIDSDFYVNDLLIRFCAAFLDQGFSQWALPDREKGFFQAFLDLYRSSPMAPNAGLRGLGKALQKVKDSGCSAIQCIEASLGELGVSREEWESFLASTLLALRGWAGMIHQMETRGDRVPLGIPQGTLIDFLAVRLLLERVALQNLSEGYLGIELPLSELRERLAVGCNASGDTHVKRAFSVFQIAQIRGWTPDALMELSPREWKQLVDEIERFSSLERRRLFQLAFEKGYRDKVLNAYAVHTRQHGLARARTHGEEPKRPSFQILCCIDDREESFRRHLEEIDPACETFGTPGFFAVPMYYRGVSEAHFVPLCPIIIKPRQYVVERVSETHRDMHGRRTKVRRALGKQVHAFHKSSRSFVGGLAMAVLGPLATLPLVGRVLFPSATARLRRAVSRMVAPPSETELTLERAGGEPGKEDFALGFTLGEMVDSVERMLSDTGLTFNWSRLVIVCGHGSSSLNNPHESAYNCGACGGGRGGPNARAVAAMANDPRVRARLRERGLSLPEDTVFLGAFHNTCSDSVTYADLWKLPKTHEQDFEQVRAAIDRARERNAHERCRRFVSARLTLNEAGALRHVEERSEDLSQTRPEYNHATNAVCVVGRRSRSRGLYLDRRSFLVSYDPHQDDDEQRILERVLSAVIPVCGGINLEYYFSKVDVAGYGCGSKLPHNVTSLLGVMDGAASDLRTGLSAQMVEIHDPVRLLFLIETSPDAFLRIMRRVPVIQRLCANAWVQVATLSPDSEEIFLLKGDRLERFEATLEDLPRVQTSREWYRGWRGNLDFAVVSEGFSTSWSGR
jgi:uncharacterized protein